MLDTKAVKQTFINSLVTTFLTDADVGGYKSQVLRAVDKFSVDSKAVGMNGYWVDSNIRPSERKVVIDDVAILEGMAGLLVTALMSGQAHAYALVVSDIKAVRV